VELQHDLGQLGLALHDETWEPRLKVRNERRVASVGVATISVLVAAVILATDGNVFAGAAFVLGLLCIFISTYRIEWGLYLFVGAVLFLDQYQVPGFTPITYRISYFENLKVYYLRGVEAAVVNPLEIHLFSLIFVWMALMAIKGNIRLHRVPLWPLALLFFGWMLVSFATGLARGGDFLPALWEVRALVYFGLLYFFVPQIIRTKEQIKTLFWICIGTISIKAFQGIERFVRLGFTFNDYPALTSHEDAAFFVTIVVLFIGLVLYGGHSQQRRVLRYLLIPLILGFIVAQRRSAFGSMGLALIAIFLLVGRAERLRMLRFVTPVIVMLAIYLAAFWNSESQLGTPAQLIKASFSNDKETAGEKYYSNLYRVVERYNLASTVQRAPIQGIGFGNRFDTPVPLAAISFPLWDYIPHNEILWMLVKTGAIGFFAFWLFLNSFIVRGSSLFRRLQDPYLKAICAVSVIAIMNQVFVSYFDLQLTFHRNMVYLGVLMGVLSPLESLQENEEKRVDVR
jgi:hypothetical protein